VDRFDHDLGHPALIPAFQRIEHPALVELIRDPIMCPRHISGNDSRIVSIQSLCQMLGEAIMPVCILGSLHESAFYVR
jgi:hypothetical protein